MKLEDLRPSASVRGISPDPAAAVTVVSVEWHGADALTLIYRPPSGGVAEEVLYRHDEPRLKLTVIAWLWARTVKSPNPAFRDVDVPLASTFMLSTKKGKEAYVEPVIEAGGYRFAVKAGLPGTDAPEVGDSEAGAPETSASEAEADIPKHGAPGNAGVPPAHGTKLGRGANFSCLMSDTPIAGDYIKAEGKAGRMGARLMAIVAEGDRGRVYLAPTPEHEERAREAEPGWRPDGDVPARLTGGTCVPYGLTKWGDLFTPPPASLSH